MSWNYRILKTKHNKEVIYEVVEAYYENGKVTGFTDISKTPLRFIGEDVDELIDVFEMVLKDLKKSKDDVLDSNMFDDETRSKDKPTWDEIEKMDEEEREGC